MTTEDKERRSKPNFATKLDTLICCCPFSFSRYNARLDHVLGLRSVICDPDRERLTWRTDADQRLRCSRTCRQQDALLLAAATASDELSLSPIFILASVKMSSFWRAAIGLASVFTLWPSQTAWTKDSGNCWLRRGGAWKRSEMALSMEGLKGTWKQQCEWG